MENKRFARTAMLLGNVGIENLKQSCVMIVGVGAVGGYCLEALARAGIGKFILVDFDVFEESNINRQILATSDSLGQKKVEVAKLRVLNINPQSDVLTIDMFLNTDNVNDLPFDSVDIVVDAIDSLNSKCALIQKLYEKGTHFISSMGAALKTDASKIKYGNLSNSKNCALAKFVRKRLRKRGVDISKIKCVWSDEQISLPQSALEIEEENGNKLGRKRNVMGSLPTITAIFGLTIANQIILSLANKK